MAAVTRPAAWVVAAVLALAWLALGPATPDLAAQVYRTDLFAREGWTIFDLSWYGGHHMPGYSLLFPPLGALAGVRVAGALAAVVSAVLFERIARRHFAERARPAALWFAIGSVTDLMIGRLTFALGIAFALAAILALQHRHRRLGLALAFATPLASPVAGLFLAMAGIAQWIAAARDPHHGRRDRAGIQLAVAAFTPAAALAVLFPEGGSQPFAIETLAAIALACGLLTWALPAGERVLRAGVLVYAGAALVAFVVASPMGGNASRLIAFAGPLLLAVAHPAATTARRRGLVLAAAAWLVVWQAWGPVRETIKGAVDPSARLAYFRPLLTFLEERGRTAPIRVEVPFTRLHWESVHVARVTSLARGWETQLDVKYNGLFRAGAEPKLTAASYRAWLAREGVHYVALPDVAPDPSGRAEMRLIRGGLPYLRPVFEARHWRVYEVLHSPGLTNGVARLTRLRSQSFTLRAPRPGLTLVRVRYTPYWRVARGDGCVSRALDGWTLVRAVRPGTIAISARFDPLRLVERSARCSDDVPVRHL
jgi:hypothetical protein